MSPPSRAGLNPLPNRAAYCANKAGVIGLTRQMALQYCRPTRNLIVLDGEFAVMVRVRYVDALCVTRGATSYGLIKNWQPGSKVGGC